MIWTEFQNAIVDRLLGDAYFTQSPTVGVFAEESEDELTGEVQTMRQKVQAALSSGSGVAVVVAEPDYEITDPRETRDTYVVTTTIAIFENRTANKKQTTGARKSGKNVAAVVHWRLADFRVFEDTELDGAFERLKVRSGNFVGEEDGIKVRELVIESRVPISIVIECIGTENPLEILVTENNQPLLVSPTKP